MPTLLQGDCLEQLAHVADGSVDMVFADLPYGMTKNKWDTCIPLAPLSDDLGIQVSGRAGGLSGAPMWRSWRVEQNR